MPATQEYQEIQNKLATALSTLFGENAAELSQNPKLAEALLGEFEKIRKTVEGALQQGPQPADGGFSQLIGLGSEAAASLGATTIQPKIDEYDDTVTAERISAVGDLYYIYQHDKIGVFQTVIKLQELFKAGTIRLSDGPGAYKLYQFDRKQTLRYTLKDRAQAYGRVFGYSKQIPAGATANRDFHKLFVHFVTQVAQFFRDKRISEVIRSNASDPSFGSVAIARRSALDLRNNVKGASYGHIMVLRIEVLQLLDEAFRILNSADIKKQYGADNAWDVIEEVMKRHLGRPQVNTSQRSRMAIAGRDVLQWLAQPYVLEANRSAFEGLLSKIGDPAEEWLTSAEALGITQPRRVVQVSRDGKATPQNRSQEASWELFD